MRPLRIRADWVVPIDAAPIHDAAVLIGEDGRFAAVGRAATVPLPPGVESLDVGRAILLPGLVNLHTHLELTGLEQSASETDFPRWILGIRRLKQARSPAEFLAAARRGLRDCWAGGVTTVADTGDSGAVIEALDALDGSGIAYHEVFGPHPEQLEESLAGLSQRTEALSRFARRRVRLGVSPHAPYTVSGPLYARVAEWARARGLPLAVHLAESRAESELVAEGKGPFAQAWKARAIPLLHDQSHQPPSRPAVQVSTPVQWLDGHGVLGPDTLCIHAVQVNAQDVARLALRGAAIAHCPVSNAAHGHGAAPLAALRSAGLRVGVGTDSVASVGRLDLLLEARAAQLLAGLEAEQALALATLDGARALGLEREIGSLTTGKWGDLIAVRPGSDGVSRGPAAAALSAGSSAVLLTVLGGRVVYPVGPT